MSFSQEHLAKRALIDGRIKAQGKIGKSMARVIAARCDTTERLVIARAVTLDRYDRHALESESEAVARYRDKEGTEFPLSDTQIKWGCSGIIALAILAGIAMCKPKQTAEEKACEQIGARSNCNGTECVF